MKELDLNAMIFLLRTVMIFKNGYIIQAQYIQCLDEHKKLNQRASGVKYGLKIRVVQMNQLKSKLTKNGNNRKLPSIYKRRSVPVCISRVQRINKYVFTNMLICISDYVYLKN